MKSALELAMEKTAGKAGTKLTDKQKKDIAEIRSVAKAKAAEEEIMARDKLASLADPQAAATLKEQSAALVRRILEKAEGKVEEIRSRRT